MITLLCYPKGLGFISCATLYGMSRILLES
jgi:hypothetical protein